MALQMVNYDLIAEKDCADLISAIKTYATHCHCLKSTWILKTDKPAEEVANHLCQLVDSDGRLIVTILTGGAGWTRSLPAHIKEWLQNNL